MQIPEQYLRLPNHLWPNPFKIFPARLDGIKGSQRQNNTPSGSLEERGIKRGKVGGEIEMKWMNKMEIVGANFGYGLGGRKKEREFYW